MKHVAFYCAIAVLVVGTTLSSVAQTTSARSQLRRTVEDSARSAYGEVRLKESPTKQNFDTLVQQLAQESFRVYITTNDNVGFNTNDFVFTVAALDRTNVKRGSWQRKLVGEGQAPDAVLQYFANLADLGGRQVVIARPGPDALVDITNTFACVTNIDTFFQTTNVTCRTNIITGVPLFDPGITGTVSAVLWAPIPDFLPKPGVSNSTKRAGLVLPAGIPLSPDATGTVATVFNNAQGRSALDVKVRGLIRGQVYSVWIASDLTPSNVLVKAGDLVFKSNGTTGRFTLDTRYGDPLPQQVPYLSDLSGRSIQILDEFEDPHLVGTIP